MDEFLPILKSTAIASGMAGVCYALARYIERRWLAFPGSLVAQLVALFLAVAFLVSPFNPGPTLLFLFALPSFLGGWFHRKSGGASNHWLTAFLLMGFTTWATIFLGMAGMDWYHHLIFNTDAFWAGILYMVGLVLYPMLAPLAVWLWKSLRARPGIEVHGELPR